MHDRLCPMNKSLVFSTSRCECELIAEVRKDQDARRQPTLFDALQQADEAIERVEKNADPEWMEAATRAVWERSRLGETFTTDEVMEDLESVNVSTHDARALGPVIRKAIKRGMITEVGMTRSRRRHGTRIPIYQGISQRKETA